MAAAGSGNAAPGSPRIPAAQGQTPSVKVEDLGKSMIEGHEVEGKRFTLPPFTPPPQPEVPELKMPGAPQASSPGAPKPPAATGDPWRQAPKLPPIPSLNEVWTSVKRKAPVIPQGYKIKPPRV